MNKKSNEALCIRNTGTWTNIKPEHKFDSSKFKKEVVANELHLLSPKIDMMIRKIEELDKIDMENDNKLYKHIIYSDISGVYGAKMVASSLIANNYSLIYSNKFALREDIIDKNKTFGLLTTSTVYKKPLTVGLKKKMMTLMNNRTTNIYGENMRIIILDSGYKEGLDVFDVKYMHILEPLITKAEYTQVIGRGTRYCGQSGLPFIPNVGWPLNIYRYNIKFDSYKTIHDLYLQHSDTNISAFNFIADIESIIIASAADTPLTENLHLLREKNNRFYDALMAKINTKGDRPIRKDLIEVVNNIRGKIYTNDNIIDCKKKCQGPLEEFPSANALLIVAAIYIIDKIEIGDKLQVKNKKLYMGNNNNKVNNYVKDTEFIKYLNEKDPKPLLCKMIDQNQNFCDAINKIWMNPINFLKLFGDKIIENLNYYKKVNMINDKNFADAIRFIYEYKSKLINKKPRFEITPPIIKLSNLELYKYVNKHFAPYKWDNIDIVNKCVSEENNKTNVVNDKNEYSIVSFSNTQNFVQKFLTPQSPYKGMFLFHSVGSGKTCTAISTATNTFDREGYKILWVTRHTLKEDIWKNMFEKICNVIIQERLKNGEILPSTKAKRMEFLGKNWLPPISYKQFTNLIKGKNKYYKLMVSLNGKEDPFKKTLIIIDEIHKIYSSTLSTLEKPNPEVLQDMIQNSYKVSGKNSLKLLIMTATPITDDHMSCIKILNLLLENNERFPEDFDIFKLKYCNENGLFTENGSYEFMNKITGLVSYIDRTNDRSQFAYPVIKDILIEIDRQPKNDNGLIEIDKKIQEYEEKLNNEDEKLNKEELKEIKKNINNMKKEKKNANKLNDDPKDVIDFINKCFLKKQPVTKQPVTKQPVTKQPVTKQNNQIEINNQ
jgi:superfamily II DNA or RNA helicase